MDLNFYSDLSDGNGRSDESEFLDPHAFNGFDAVQKFPGGSDNYLTISGDGHHFLSSEMFHTPSLGDEELEIPPISLDPDSTLGVSDVVATFGELGDGSSSGVPVNAVVGGNDPSFASTFVNAPSQGLEHLSLISQQPILGSTLGMDLGHPISSQFSNSSPMTIDVPLSDMSHSLLGHNQLTTIDQSELSAQLGLSLGGGTILPHPQSPDQSLSAADSPSDSIQDDDMDEFRRKSMLMDSPVSLSVSSGVVSLSPSVLDPPVIAPAPSPAPVRKATGGGGKKGKKKKDPNEPQKPVSAYALFFRDTQAAIKGQNPNATFGEVSKIVASMWDSLGEEQKQVYKRKTEAAKKEYLKALTAYKAGQLSQATIEVMDTAPSPPAAPEPPPTATPTRSSRIPLHAPDNNTITNICTSNIILDLPQVTTRSRTGAHKPATTAPPAIAPSLPAVTKITLPKHQAQSSPSAAARPTARQPPPLQQMQNTPPPPRLQQMVHSPAPPPLLAKPRGSAGAGQVIATAPPPPLKIKIVPAPVQMDLNSQIIVTTPGTTPIASTAVEELQSTAMVEALSPSATEEVAEEGMEVELNVSPGPDVTPSDAPSVCIRAGCNNPSIESKDWDREYCSNECVATHCRDVFMAWCAIRGQNSTTVT
ncbi:TOX high mobility group box family member 4b isoform X1 [Misgurnus anguillicaudatus]|uniref:TOX high mobility group box family member 4b isoform X1 n=1 Tax=Misgurnus anguillicaudatus TaxID=75329 RepID=UPI003CCF67E3